MQADLAATRTATGRGPDRAASGRGWRRRRLGPARLPAHARRRLAVEGRLVRAQAAARSHADDRRGARRPGGPRARTASGGLREVTKLREAGSGPALLREAGRQARWIAESAVRRQGAVAEEDRALELRAGAEIEQALSELAELGLPHSPQDVIAAVSELDVPMWRGPTEGTGPRDQSLPRPRPPGRPHVRLLDAGRRLPAPRHRRAAALRRRSPGAGPARAKEGRGRGPLPVLGLPLAAEAAPLALLAERRRRGRGDVPVAVRRRGPRAARARSCPQGIEERDEAIVAEAGGRGLAESVFDLGSAPSERELARARAADRPADRERPAAARAAAARAGARADAGDQAVRPLHARGVRPLPLPLVHRPRAQPAADRARGRAADQRLDRPQGARVPLRGPARPRAASDPRVPGRLAQRAPAS